MEQAGRDSMHTREYILLSCSSSCRRILLVAVWYMSMCCLLFRQAKGRDATILDSAGLLTNAVMAHAVCLTDDELHLLAARWVF